MYRVLSIALSMVFGSFGLVLLKSTVISFTNLIMDSFNFRFATEKITPPDTKHEIIDEFLHRTAWLQILLKKVFFLKPHHSEDICLETVAENKGTGTNSFLL
jgi:hypothetical protein